jgi:hypothetical protein
VTLHTFGISLEERSAPCDSSHIRNFFGGEVGPVVTSHIRNFLGGEIGPVVTSHIRNFFGGEIGPIATLHTFGISLEGRSARRDSSHVQNFLGGNGGEIGPVSTLHTFRISLEERSAPSRLFTHSEFPWRGDRPRRDSSHIRNFLGGEIGPVMTLHTFGIKSHTKRQTSSRELLSQCVAVQQHS